MTPADHAQHLLEHARREARRYSDPARAPNDYNPRGIFRFQAFYVANRTKLRERWLAVPSDATVDYVTFCRAHWCATAVRYKVITELGEANLRATIDRIMALRARQRGEVVEADWRRDQAQAVCA